ncbi:MAG: hypothetical protein ABIR68_05085, partial [Ilumatobacteraceae bacterium]
PAKIAVDATTAAMRQRATLGLECIDNLPSDTPCRCGCDGLIAADVDTAIGTPGGGHEGL